MKVYMLTAGEDSDYHVLGIYSTRERAEFVQSKISGDIEELPMDLGHDELRDGFTGWRVVMLRNGDTENVEPYNLFQCPYPSVAMQGWILRQRGGGRLDALACIVWARDAEHAVKIANEKRVQMIACGEWEAT